MEIFMKPPRFIASLEQVEHLQTLVLKGNHRWEPRSGVKFATVPASPYCLTLSFSPAWPCEASEHETPGVLRDHKSWELSYQRRRSLDEETPFSWREREWLIWGLSWIQEPGKYSLIKGITNRSALCFHTVSTMWAGSRRWTGITYKKPL